jgi:hypothetical protein
MSCHFHWYGSLCTCSHVECVPHTESANPSLQVWALLSRQPQSAVCGVPCGRCQAATHPMYAWTEACMSVVQLMVCLSVPYGSSCSMLPVGYLVKQPVARMFAVLFRLSTTLIGDYWCLHHVPHRMPHRVWFIELAAGHLPAAEYNSTSTIHGWLAGHRE